MQRMLYMAFAKSPARYCDPPNNVRFFVILGRWFQNRSGRLHATTTHASWRCIPRMSCRQKFDGRHVYFTFAEGTSEVDVEISLQVENSKLLPRKKRQKHTTGGIPRWSPTLVLVARFSAYVWQTGRDAQFSLTYGRM
jgi:hypothetical protein